MATMPYTPAGTDNVKDAILTKLKGNDDYTEGQLTDINDSIGSHTHSGGAGGAGVYYVCTSATRPTVTTEGVEIYETDTTNRYTWDNTNSKWRVVSFNKYSGTPVANTLDTTYIIENPTVVIDTTTDQYALWAWNGTNWYKFWSENITIAGGAGVTYLLKLQAGATIDIGPAIVSGGTNYLKEDGSWDNPIPATLDAISDVATITEAQGQIIIRTASEWDALAPGTLGKIFTNPRGRGKPFMAIS